MDYSDDQLVLMIHESEEAKDLLFQKYRYIIDVEIKNYIHVANMLSYDYNDLYQDALVGFADALKSYREDRDMALSSFITLCVKRKLQVSIIKAGRNKNKVMNESLSLEHKYASYTAPLRDVLSDHSKNDPLQAIVKEEKFQELCERIETSLSQGEYEVYCLLINGLSYNEIALLLDRTPKQVDNSIQRIKNKVRAILDNNR